MTRISGYLWTAAGAMALAACGGGGGGGAGAVAPITASAIITSQNAPAIAGAVVGATSGTQSVGDLGGLGAGPGTLTVQEPSSPGAPPTAEVTIGPDMLPCLFGGTQTLLAEIADPLTTTSGDSISVTFAACNEGDGMLLDGAFGFVVQSFLGDPLTGILNMSVAVTVTDLAITEAGVMTSMNGTMNLTLDASNPTSTTVILDGTELTLVSGVETESLSDFAIITTVDPLAGTSTFEINGYVMSSEFTGDVNFSTMEALQIDVSGDPSTGEVMITGADGATITMRIVSAQQVELDIDFDGDGTIDEMQVTTWADLQGLT